MLMLNGVGDVVEVGYHYTFGYASCAGRVI